MRGDRRPEALRHHMHNLFDSNFRDGRKYMGGIEKMVELDTSHVLSKAKIETVNTASYELLWCTQRAVAICYIDIPSDPKTRDIFSNIIKENYVRSMKFKETSDGIVDIFRAILEEGEWLAKDAAQENSMPKHHEVEFMKGSSEIGKYMYIAVEPATRKRKIL